MNININGINYEVSYDNDIITADNSIGQIKYNQQQIKLHKNIGDDVKLQTLMHEIIHGILYSNHYHDLNIDEEFVDRLATTIVNMMDTNDLLAELKYKLLDELDYI